MTTLTSSYFTLVPSDVFGTVGLLPCIQEQLLRSLCCPPALLLQCTERVSRRLQGSNEVGKPSPASHPDSGFQHPVIGDPREMESEFNRLFGRDCKLVCILPIANLGVHPVLRVVGYDKR